MKKLNGKTIEDLIDELDEFFTKYGIHSLNPKNQRKALISRGLAENYEVATKFQEYSKISLTQGYLYLILNKYKDIEFIEVGPQSLHVENFMRCGTYTTRTQRILEETEKMLKRGRA